MPNALINEKSLYLLQHADNPVDWLPWSEEAFAQAVAEDKPIFLSAGYSTCHWCHVMERESFENEATAALLNKYFINIKLDREERPDIDSTYMAVVQATTGHAGHPMSIWLAPDLTPLLGGTYFPPEDKGGRAGFPRVIEQVAQLWKEDRENLLKHGKDLVAKLQEHLKREPDPSALPSAQLVATAYLKDLANRYDQKHGGFSAAPKFPRPALFGAVFHLSCEADDREMALETLKAIHKGGIHDHLGGGFHRYSVDRYWHVPHFEKMLYDQAQLATSYLEAQQISDDPIYKEVANDIFSYLEQLRDKAGGYYCAEDADSLEADQANEGTSGNAKHKKEGAYYVWTWQELEALLSEEELSLYAAAYGVQPEGNATPEGDPIGEFSGENILYRATTNPELESRFENVEEKLKSIELKLLQERSKRPKPHLDDKILSAWNGLTLSALSQGARILQRSDLLQRAVDCANFLKNNLWDEKEKTLRRSYREGSSKIAGFATDYVFIIQGLLELFRSSGEVSWLKWAVELQDSLDSQYLDKEQGGYFNSKQGEAHAFLSIKEEHDGAEPSPNGVAACNLITLVSITGKEKYLQQAEAILQWAQQILESYPSAAPWLCRALSYFENREQAARLVVLCSDTKSPLLQSINQHFLPELTVLPVCNDQTQDYLATGDPTIAEMKRIDEQDTAYLCHGQSCSPPVTSSEELIELLSP